MSAAQLQEALDAVNQSLAAADTPADVVKSQVPAMVDESKAVVSSANVAETNEGFHVETPSEAPSVAALLAVNVGLFFGGRWLEVDRELGEYVGWRDKSKVRLLPHTAPTISVSPTYLGRL